MHRLFRLRILAGFAVTVVVLATGCSRNWFGQRPDSQSPLPKTKSAVAETGDLAPQDVAKVCVTTAEQMASKGHYREAILLYEKARVHDPKAANYARRLAALHDLAGNAPLAEKEYLLALQAEPEDAELLTDYGYFKYARGELDQAEVVLRKVIARSANHERAAMNLGLVLAAQGNYQASFEAFRKVVGDAAAHSNVGILLAKHGRDAEAEQAFQSAVALDANLSQAQQFLAFYVRQRQSNAVAARSEPGNGQSMRPTELVSFNDPNGEPRAPSNETGHR